MCSPSLDVFKEQNKFSKHTNFLTFYAQHSDCRTWNNDTKRMVVEECSWCPNCAHETSKTCIKFETRTQLTFDLNLTPYFINIIFIFVLFFFFFTLLTTSMTTMEATMMT